MKITEVKTFVVGNPPPAMGGRYFIFVKLTTDSGITGIGEVYSATFSPRIRPSAT
jgi:galactonate dehydratase